MVSLLTDVIAVTVAIITVIICAKRGFLSAAVSFVGALFSVIAANFMSSFLSQYLYLHFVHDKLYNAIFNSIKDLKDFSGVSAQLQLIDRLPAAVRQLIRGLDTETILSSLSDKSADTAETVARTLTDDVIGPAAITVMSAVTFLVVFLLCLWLVKLLSKALVHVRDIPLVGPVNTLFGAVIGVLQAAIILYLLFTVFQFVLTVFGPFSFMSVQDLERSRLFSFFSTLHF